MINKDSQSQVFIFLTSNHSHFIKIVPSSYCSELVFFHTSKHFQLKDMKIYISLLLYYCNHKYMVATEFNTKSKRDDFKTYTVRTSVWIVNYVD
jgi:hypothetical protein